MSEQIEEVSIPESEIAIEAGEVPKLPVTDATPEDVLAEEAAAADAAADAADDDQADDTDDDDEDEDEEEPASGQD